jgi:2,5-furandicarboxylate decarboxylase 1
MPGLGLEASLKQQGIIDTGFRTALKRLADADRLIFFPEELDPELQIASIADRFAGGAAVFFEKVKGHSVPIAANILGSPANTMCVFQRDTQGMRDLMQRAITQPISPQRVDGGPCQEVVVTEGIDLGRMLPILRHAPKDCGRFITAGVVVARDPDSGVSNASFHRLQLIGPNRTGVRLDRGRHLGTLIEKAKEAGKCLDIAVCIGPDLSMLYASASSLPLETDELSIASGLKGEPLNTVTCKTVDIDVPAECEIVLEGRIDPNDMVHEGPFGEFVGMYSDAGPMPTFTVSALTRRERPIYHIGYSETGIGLRKYIFENLVLRKIKDAVPEVVDIEVTAGSLNLFHLVVSISKKSAADDALPEKVIHAALEAHRYVDLIIVVDDDIDIKRWNDVEYALTLRFDATNDLHLFPGRPTHEYVRKAKNGIRTKMGLDATVPFDERARFERVEYTPVNLEDIRHSTEGDVSRFLS